MWNLSFEVDAFVVHTGVVIVTDWLGVMRLSTLGAWFYTILCFWKRVFLYCCVSGLK